MFLSIWAFALDHSGTIATETWYKADNPHIITGDVSIPSGDTLTIEPGCLIKFNSGLQMTVAGVLISSGTVSDTIYFTSSAVSPSQGDWENIYFNNPDSGCIMEYNKILYGGYGTDSCLLNISAKVGGGGYHNVSVSHCYLGESAGYGIRISKASLARITDCTISDCATFPITTNAFQVPYIYGNMSFSSNNPNQIKVLGKTDVTTATWHCLGIPYFIWGNDIVVSADNILTIKPGVEIRFEPGHTRRINVHGGLYAVGTSDSVIVFTSNRTTHIPGDWRGINFPESTITSYMTYCDVGYAGAVVNNSDSTNIRLMASQVVMRNCHIHHSAKKGLIVKGGSHITLINNRIINNAGVGIDIVRQGGASADFGSDPTEWNDIYNNGDYDLTNGLHDTYARYVYWGTTDCSLISDTIYDYIDNTSLGLVDFNPWLDASHNVASTTSGTWTGTTDSDWRTATNWNGGAVPCYIMDVEIPGTAANFPGITGNEMCRNLTMKPNAEMTVESTGDFKTLGDFEMQANSSGDIPSLVNYGDFSVRDSSIIQDYISSGRWHYISSPLTNDTAGVFMDMYLYSFDESIYDTNATGQTTAGWVNISDETASLTPGAGYKVWSFSSNPGNKTVYFTQGDLNDGTTELPTTATDQDGNSSIDGKEGWNLVGNPFPSAIDWDNSGWIGKSKFDASIYVYDGTQYLSWNGSTGSLTDGVIPAMQAFFVKANDFSPLLKVGNNARVHGVSPYKGSEIQNLLKLTVQGNGFKDETFINFDVNATENYDSQYDAYKLKGIDEAPQLYSIAGDDILSINVLPRLDEEVTVPLGFEVGKADTYVMTASETESFNNGTDIYLEDLKENVLINLSEQDEYMFNANPLDEPDRFILHFFGVQGENNFQSDSGVQIYSYGSEVFIRNNMEMQLTAGVTVLNISGQNVWYRKLSLTDIEQINLNLKPGYYIVRVSTSKGVYNKRVVLW